MAKRSDPPWRRLARMERGDKGNPNPNHGPSWILMLILILIAMAVAIGVAEAFIHPMLHPK